MTKDARPYIGRFAPTPSGPLHLGSLSTALASWLFARKVKGEWFLRIDDLDTLRCRTSHITRILKQLEGHGLWWNGTPYRQSRRVDLYHNALSRLKTEGLVYPCVCTRITSRRDGPIGQDGPIYSGRCRNGFPSISPERVAYRLRAPSGRIFLDDRHFGYLERDIGRDIGDFIVRRTDGVIGYYLASAIDEHDMGITEVVRGADLLLSSLRHQLVQTALQLPPTTYRHVPIILNGVGVKLSKQNGAPPAHENNASANLAHILKLFAQRPPPDLTQATPKIVLEWAIQHWKPDRIPKSMKISLEPNRKNAARLLGNPSAVQ